MSSDAGLDDRDEEALAAALEGYFSALESGTAPDPATYASGFPDIEKRLRRCLAGLADMHDAIASDPGGTSSSDGRKRKRKQLQSLPTGHVLGDFRLLNEIGRGGMGVVYEAEQLSLNRRVAVKVLPFAAFLDDRRRQRFLNEAHAAATLQHEHIVPVYATGCDQGVHFYAMRLVHGSTLASLISQAKRRSSLSSSDPSANPSSSTMVDRLSATQHSGGGKSAGVIEAVQLALQIAGALQHAHDLGVVHRDVKPGNIMIDERGHAWLTDFGLARRDAAENVTDAGDVVGTLRYMSPEQASGNSALADPRSDVYSLGATLYELLALRPVFDAGDRGTLLRQIVEDDPPPLRKSAPRVPRDLETIVHRTLAKSPSARYQSAAELAEDLERFLADRPILARRPSPMEVVRRWIRKHQATSAAAAAALVVAVCALAVGNFRLSHALEETDGFRRHADELRVRAERERAAANENFREALEAVDVYLLNANETRLRDIPGAATVRREMLQAAANFYERLAAKRAGDDALVFQRGNAQYRLGTVLLELDDFVRAAPALEAAEATFRRAAAKGDEHAKVRLAQTLHAKSRLADENWLAGTEDVRRFEEVEAALDYVPQEATTSHASFLFVRNSLDKAVAFRERRQPAKAADAIRQCEAPLAELVRRLPTDAAVAQQEFTFHLEKAAADVARRRTKPARQSFDKARAAAKRYSGLKDDAPGSAYLLAIIDFREASMEMDLLSYASARQRLDEAAVRVAAPPDSSPYRRSSLLLAARIHFLRGGLLRRIGDLAGGMNALWAAEAAFARISTPRSYDAYAELRRGETLSTISSLHQERGRHSEALNAALTAKSIGELLVKRRPGSARSHALLARGRHGIGMAMTSFERTSDAEAEFAAAVVAQREACSLAPWDADYPRYLANHLLGRGRSLLALQRPDEALEAFRECCRVQPNHPHYPWASATAFWKKFRSIAFKDDAHKNRCVRAVVEFARRGAELTSSEWMDSLGVGGNAGGRSVVERK